MTEIKTIPWNTEDHLETPEDIAAIWKSVSKTAIPSSSVMPSAPCPAQKA